MGSAELWSEQRIYERSSPCSAWITESCQALVHFVVYPFGAVGSTSTKSTPTTSRHVWSCIVQDSLNFICTHENVIILIFVPLNGSILKYYSVENVSAGTLAIFIKGGACVMAVWFLFQILFYFDVFIWFKVINWVYIFWISNVIIHDIWNEEYVETLRCGNGRM
jgi:hypothetical protein